MSSDRPFGFGLGPEPQEPNRRGAKPAGRKRPADRSHDSGGGDSSGGDSSGRESSTSDFNRDDPVGDPLREVLHKWQAPKPSGELRSSARDRLLRRKDAQASVDEQPAVQSEGGKNESEGFSTLGIALKSWRAMPVRAEFRSELKEKFMEGVAASDFSATNKSATNKSATSKPATRKPSTSASAPDSLRLGQPLAESKDLAQRKEPERPAPASNRSRRAKPVTNQPKPRGWFRATLGTGLIAAGVAIFLWAPWRKVDLPAEPQVAQGWSVIEGAAPWVDGVQLSKAQVQLPTIEAKQSLRATNGGSTRVAFGRLFQVALSPGSELDLSNFDPDAQELRLGMVGGSGGFAIQTGPDFKAGGRRLLFQTPESEIEVVGTVFAIDRYEPTEDSPGGTCVCCSEGKVHVSQDKFEHLTNAGQSVFLFAGNGEPFIGPVLDQHKQPMQALAEAKRPPSWLLAAVK